MSLVEQTAQTIAQYEMLEPEQRVLVALSGGADSVALLLVLRELGYPVYVYHLNHCLRGEESERDAEFVHSLCTKLHVSCTIEREDVQGYAQQLGESIETAARRLRYERLRRCAQEQGIERIATAHTADDNLETMLFHLARGTGAKGMTGIPPVRGNLIRPIFRAVRTEIEVYLETVGQTFVTDSSNLTLDYTRNRIRHAVVPVLRQINPQCAGAAARLAQQLRADDGALCTLAQQALARGKTQNGIALCAFDTFPAVQSRMLMQLLTEAGVPMQQVSARHIGLLTALLTSGDFRSCSLPAGFRAYREQDCLRVIYEPERLPIPLFDGFAARLWDTATKLTITRKKPNEVFPKTCDTFQVDCGTIKFGTLTARVMRSGDRLRLSGARGSRQLKRIFADRHIPPSVQARLAVLEDCQGIVAVQSVGIAYDRIPCGNDILEIRFEGL
ncbi:MAG: tRNA lysidine(34) synthetase TilS [Butyricicoccus pullicaecorum]|nr:tRNA lysidine(34) synthetase TilS [Butyricicoccus pullicaecorum]